ncbi:MAG: hypothetical protein IJ758_00770 [Clostridia bacterium]|nr:hypothetical protein [Clostridia bacterium]
MKKFLSIILSTVVLSGIGASVSGCFAFDSKHIPDEAVAKREIEVSEGKLLDCITIKKEYRDLLEVEREGIATVCNLMEPDINIAEKKPNGILGILKNILQKNITCDPFIFKVPLSAVAKEIQIKSCNGPYKQYVWPIDKEYRNIAGFKWKTICCETNDPCEL